MSTVPMNNNNDAMGGGWNWFSSASDAVGGLLNIGSQWEALRQQRDATGQGQAELANAVETDVNQTAIGGQAAAGANSPGGFLSGLPSNAVILAGAGVVGILLITLIVKK
jgi:hypothetical protein